jgi:hypothetical protein
MTDSTENEKDLSQVIIGLLLGSGCAGAAVGFIGEEGLQFWGFLTFIICVVGTFIVYFSNKYWITKSRETDIRELSDCYISCFNTTGQLLAARLEGVTCEEVKQKNTLTQKVFRILVSDLKSQSENIPGSAIRSVIQKDINRIIEEWQKIALTEIDTAEEIQGPE